jgi:hypothetical protein
MDPEVMLGRIQELAQIQREQFRRIRELERTRESLQNEVKKGKTRIIFCGVLFAFNSTSFVCQIMNPFVSGKSAQLHLKKKLSDSERQVTQLMQALSLERKRNAAAGLSSASPSSSSTSSAECSYELVNHSFASVSIHDDIKVSPAAAATPPSKPASTRIRRAPKRLGHEDEHEAESIELDLEHEASSAELMPDLEIADNVSLLIISDVLGVC